MRSFAKFLLEQNSETAIPVGTIPTASPIAITKYSRANAANDAHEGLVSIANAVQAKHKQAIFGENGMEDLAQRRVLSGDTTHLFHSGISHSDFANFKPKIKSINVRVDPKHVSLIHDSLRTGDMHGPYEVVGTQRKKDRLSVRMRHQRTGQVHEFNFAGVPNHNSQDTHDRYNVPWSDEVAGLTPRHRNRLLSAVAAAKGMQYTPQEGLKHGTRENPQVETGLRGIARHLFGPQAEDQYHELHSFGGVSRLIKQYIPKNKHEEIIERTKSMTRPNKQPSSPEDPEVDEHGFMSAALEAAKRLPNRRMSHAEVLGRLTAGRGVPGSKGRVKDEIAFLGLRQKFQEREQDGLKTIDPKTVAFMIRNKRFSLKDQTEKSKSIKEYLKSYPPIPFKRMPHKEGFEYLQNESDEDLAKENIRLRKGIASGELNSDEHEKTLTAIDKELKFRYPGEMVKSDYDFLANASRKQYQKKIKDLLATAEHHGDKWNEAMDNGDDEGNLLHQMRFRHYLRLHNEYKRNTDYAFSGGSRTKGRYDLDRDPFVIRGETSTIMPEPPYGWDLKGSHTGVEGELHNILHSDRTDDSGNKTLFVGQLQSDTAQSLGAELKRAGKKRQKKLDLSDYPESVRDQLENPMLTKTNLWTGAGVRHMTMKAINGGYGSISFPTGSTNAIIQGNDRASDHYDTNVRAELERVAKHLGGRVRLGGVKVEDPEKLNKHVTSLRAQIPYLTDKVRSGFTTYQPKLTRLKNQLAQHEAVPEGHAPAYILDLPPDAANRVKKTPFTLFEDVDQTAPNPASASDKVKQVVARRARHKPSKKPTISPEEREFLKSGLTLVGGSTNV